MSNRLGVGVGNVLQVMKSTVWHQCLRTQTSKVHTVEKPMKGAYKMHVFLLSFEAEIMNWKCPMKTSMASAYIQMTRVTEDREW